MIETSINGKTLDLAEDNISKLKSIFPDVFAEGKVDFEKLQQVLGNYIETSNERYNFTWNGKAKALRLSQTPSTGTLRPCKEESKDWDTTQNLYIEGDNLEVLKLLQKSYHGKIKMIYIDPPYNTGKDFVYNDNFTDSIENYKAITGQVDDQGNKISNNSETSGRYHTDWLNMMYPRLRLARNLLSNNGAIFISIDDNEVTNLRKLCDEIYGEENFIGQITVINNLKGRNDKKNIATCHEYLLIYGKYSFETNGLPLTEEQKSAFDKFDEKGNRYQLRDLRKRGRPDRREDRPNMYFPIYYNVETKECSLEFHEGWIEIFPLRGDGTDGRWRWGKERVQDNLSILEPKYSNGAAKWGIEHRVYLNPSLNPINIDEDNEDTEIDDVSERSSKSKSFWMGGELSSDVARRQYRELMGDTSFDYPKSIDLLLKIIYMGLNDNDIILDFFSGSATTAHALMKLNADDKGKRKFIMIQLPELSDEKSEAYRAGYRNICEIGKERIRRAGEKIKEENGMLAYCLDVGFKVLKLDSSNIRKWQPNYDNLEISLNEYIDNFVNGRTELDVVYEIMIKYGLDLSYSVDEHTIIDKKVYSIGIGMLVICLDNELTIELANGILGLIKELSPESSRVVFKDNGFKTDSNKTNIKEILKCGGVEEFITL